AITLGGLSQFVFQDLKINASGCTAGRQLAVDHDCRNGNFSARASTRASIMSRTMTSDVKPASRLTASITSWQSAHPALNTSTLRLLDTPLTTFEFVQNYTLELTPKSIVLAVIWLIRWGIGQRA